MANPWTSRSALQDRGWLPYGPFNRCRMPACHNTCQLMTEHQSICNDCQEREEGNWQHKKRAMLASKRRQHLVSRLMRSRGLADHHVSIICVFLSNDLGCIQPDFQWIFLLEQFGWNYTSGASGTNLGPGVRDPEGSGGPTRGEHLAAPSSKRLGSSAGGACL